MWGLDNEPADKEFLDRAVMCNTDFSIWLPKKIFYIHVHLGKEEHYRELSLERKKTAMTPSYSYELPLEKLQEVYSKLLKNRNLSFLAFPFPSKETKIKEANTYLSLNKYCLILPYDYTETELENVLDSDNVYGIKVYYEFGGDKKYSEFIIDDFITDSFLRKINNRNQIIMLHVPKNSLNDSLNISWINKVLIKYPNIKIILAHMGRCHTLESIKSALDSIKITPNLFMDSSTVSEKDVFKYCIKKLGYRKILFGSDLPYALRRGKIFDLPGPRGGALITEDIHPWTLPEHRKWYLENRPKLTYMFYHSLEVIRVALEELDLVDKKEDIFYNNALQLLSSIK